MFVVGVVLPVGAAVGRRRGKCLSVHLEVDELVARARGVRRVAAAAVGADQTQEEGEEAHAWRHTDTHKMSNPYKNTLPQETLGK